MRMYLRNDLLKSEGAKASDKTPVNPDVATGEQRGGKYVARTQVGYDKDGSPKYRYFQTEDEYETYLSGKGQSKEGKKLETKVKKEHRESKEKQNSGGTKHQPASRKTGLLGSDKPVAKSFRLYVRT